MSTSFLKSNRQARDDAHTDAHADAPTEATGAAPLRVVLLGLGTVGGGVYQLLARRPEVFDIRRVVVRNRARVRDVQVPRELLSTNLWDAINEPADLVIEVVGGVTPVGDIVQAALLAGRTVISANKALVARRWRTLSRFASGTDRTLRFSAAVGGELPVLETIESLRDRGVASVRGVVNGTCNFVLDSLEAGSTFAEAVRLAQERGFAEADPRSDLSGEDAAHKLELIARTAFRHGDALRVRTSGIEGITPGQIAAARADGRRLRLVASCSRTAAGVDAQVSVVSLPGQDYLAGTRAEENRVEVLGSDGRVVRLAGKGAGRWPTARSVLADVHAHLHAQLATASTRREQHARRIVLLEDELALHQAVVAGK